MGLGATRQQPYAEFSSEAWFADTIGDEFYLYGNGKELSKGSITTKAPRYFLNVLLNNLLPTSLQEGLVDVYWEVVRKASGQRSRSTTEKYLVKKTRPAGIDRRPDIFGHDGLRVVAEGFSADADIDASTAANGMWALVDKYQNARENDEIFVYLDGIATKRRLSAAEAAGAGPYRVFIPSAVFQRISQSGTVALICTVIDVAGNIPEGNDKFSPPYLLSSNLDPALFDPPLFYVNGLESTLLDLGTQSNLPLSVLATPPRSVAIASPPNQIVVTLTLIKADGTQTSKRLPPFSHTQRAGNQTPVPNEYFKEEGFVRMSFELFTPTGALLGRSGSSTVRVVGTPVLTYPAPAFDNKPGPQTITLQNYLNGAAVAVAYRSMSPADVIRLNWSIPNGNVVNIAPQTGTTGGTVFFPISAQILAQSAGQTIKLSYQVTVGGKTPTSETQELTVQTASVADYPRALINGIADGGTLELSYLVGDAYIAITKWPLSVAGQTITITLNSEGVVPLTVRSDYRILESEALNGLANIAVSRSWLNSVPHGNKIIITCSINTNGQTIAFPQTTYLLLSPLRIDSSLVMLSGQSILSGINLINDFPGNTITRLPEGGRRPYTFSAIGDRVTVDANTGKITGLRSGSAVITVTDANRNSVNYTVNVSNCWMLHLVGWGNAKDGQANFVINRNALIGGGFPSARELTETDWGLLYHAFGKIPISVGPQATTYFWTTAVVNGGGVSMAYNQFNGTRTLISVNTPGQSSLFLSAV
ncbi:hypothetical protein K0P33_19540 [Pseudomonas sp. ArH3a]|uniref:hypothetical protein n=1 Tax=Pseudomonas sp. ArH3a TaxID=2862945 RepID=UPI001F59EAF5|nr:hypothetical protein [Pseudomonas sp. ArH3a]UNM17753.1 hypothetical protein K0P33_19540 [Pseudomonas sp. ArH3a]